VNSAKKKGTRVPRRTVLSGSAKLVVAATAAAMLPAEAAADRTSGPSDGSQRETTGRSHIKHVNPATMAAAKGYTPVVEATGGRTIYVSGQVAVDRTGAVVGTGNLRAQTQQVFENLKAGLEAVGAGFADVVKLNIYVLDISQVQVVRDVRDKYVDTARPPANTLVEVRKLVREEFLIEIDAVANVVA
jgi:enamine deaminase RidA (YjgF/YER057c/UK114 family)